MAMEMRLSQKLVTKLVMTPMLQQAIKLLPLARLELAQLVRQEITENPILEELLEGEEEKDTPDEPVDEPAAMEEAVPAEQAPIAEEQDWDNFIQSNIDRGSSADNYTEAPSLEATYKKDPSLTDHLHWQLSLSLDSEEDKYIGACIIGNIQNDGYLCADLAEIAADAGCALADAERILGVIQGFEPTGVAARSLSECLLLQLRARPKRNPLAEKLAERYLERLEERFLQKIASELDAPVEKVLAAVRLIRTLDPKPGLQFQSEGIDYITPDITVVKTEAGYDVVLNDEGVPRLRINPFYHDMLTHTQEGKTREYLENKYRSALWLIKSIDQRRQTIYKVGKSIVKLQQEFLDKGLSYLKPMVLKDVARDIDMHESTVSRITTNKYIDTPQGIFELKYFFHSGIKSYMGTSLSSIRVKNMIKEVIGQEDPRHPLTDDEMVQVLMRKNAKIARRTITKYRKELNIPPASKRRKLF